MNKKKLITMVATLGLVAALGVGGSLALLSAQSNTVTNTFTVGTGLTDANIKLDEKDIDNSTDNTERDTENHYTNIEPNTKLEKDPTVTISGNHAKCYVFVRVTGVDAMNSINDVQVTKFNANLKKIDGQNTVDGLYVYAVDGTPAEVAENAGLSLVVFDGITIGVNADLYKDGVGKKLDNIVVKACAVQSAGTTNTYTNALNAIPSGF